jgi:hypothetical protein
MYANTNAGTSTTSSQRGVICTTWKRVEVCR